MKSAKAICHRCETEFSVYATDADLNRGIAYGQCPGCSKEGKFSLSAMTPEREKTEGVEHGKTE